jgi:hypothetical protein
MLTSPVRNSWPVVRPRQKLCSHASAASFADPLTLRQRDVPQAGRRLRRTSARRNDMSTLPFLIRTALHEVTAVRVLDRFHAPREPRHRAVAA